MEENCPTAAQIPTKNVQKKKKTCLQNQAQLPELDLYGLTGFPDPFTPSFTLKFATTANKFRQV